MESISELKIICQGQKRNKNFLLYKGYILHRNLSIYITRFLLMYFPKISPNQITFLLIFISIIGIIMLLINNFYIQIFGIVLVYFGFLLDKVDGELARYKNFFTLTGVYLDELYHVVVSNFLLFGFFYNILWQQKIYILLFIIILFLNILNRFNRKFYSILYVKLYDLLRERKIYYNKKDNVLINKIFNNFLFRICSIIERFDIVILTISIVIVLNRLLQLDIRVYYLYIYTILSIVYFIRWTVLNYFGMLKKNVKNLLDNNEV